ncbi:MAG: hypothetical protein AAFX76_00660 [Planctomycetota bacterium]
MPKTMDRFGVLLSVVAAAFCVAVLGTAGPAEADDVTLERGTPYLVAAGRSPIPQAGERFDRPIEARRLVDDSGRKTKPAAPDGVVAWGAAHNYVGQRITVEGKIVDTYNHRGEVCFLNFSKEWRGKFYIPVFDEVFPELPEPPETYYLNKTVRVTGTVTLHRNRPNIEVQNVKQIEIVD